MRRRARRCSRTFNEEARQPNFPGLLVDFDHFSHDPAQPTTAAGWIGGAGASRRRALRADPVVGPRPPGADGRALPARVAGVEPGRLRSVDRAGAADGRETVHLRPRRLDRLALTNDPNLPGLAPLSNRGRSEVISEGVELAVHGHLPNVRYHTMNLRTEILQRLAPARHGERRRDRRGAARAGGGAGDVAQSLRAV